MSNLQGVVYTVLEACKIMRIGKTAFYRALNRGDVRAVKIGNRTLIPEESIRDFLSGEKNEYKPKEK